MPYGDASHDVKSSMCILILYASICQSITLIIIVYLCLWHLSNGQYSYIFQKLTFVCTLSWQVHLNNYIWYNTCDFILIPFRYCQLIWHIIFLTIISVIPFVGGFMTCFSSFLLYSIDIMVKPGFLLSFYNIIWFFSYLPYSHQNGRVRIPPLSIIWLSYVVRLEKNQFPLIWFILSSSLFNIYMFIS